MFKYTSVRRCVRIYMAVCPRARLELSMNVYMQACAHAHVSDCSLSSLHVPYAIPVVNKSVRESQKRIEQYSSIPGL